MCGCERERERECVLNSDGRDILRSRATPSKVNDVADLTFKYFT